MKLTSQNLRENGNLYLSFSSWDANTSQPYTVLYSVANVFNIEFAKSTANNEI